jgi:hypothetical protein
MSLSDLFVLFWGYALETSAFILNRATSKSVETTARSLRCRSLEFGDVRHM